MSPTINLATLGRRVRETRLNRKMTLEEVVAKTDFTVSWLSKLENGQLSPSLEGLVALAAALNCGVDSLVESLTVPPRHVLIRAGNNGRAAARKQQPSRNGRSRNGEAQHLAAGWTGAAMEPVVLSFSPGERSRSESFNGERFVLVLQGRIRLEYGDEAIQLDNGDSIYFDGSCPHQITAAGRTTARVLSVTPTPG